MTQSDVDVEDDISEASDESSQIYDPRAISYDENENNGSLNNSIKQSLSQQQQSKAATTTLSKISNNIKTNNNKSATSAADQSDDYSNAFDDFDNESETYSNDFDNNDHRAPTLQKQQHQPNQAAYYITSSSSSSYPTNTASSSSSTLQHFQYQSKSPTVRTAATKSLGGVFVPTTSAPFSSVVNRGIVTNIALPSIQVQSLQAGKSKYFICLPSSLPSSNNNVHYQILSKKNVYRARTR